MVVQDGEPLASAVVVLVNVDPTITWASTALTDASGKAVMKTKGMYDGVPAGTYKATVAKQELERQGGDPYAGAPDPKADYDKYMLWVSQNEAKIVAASNQAAQLYDLVDLQFGDITKTPLEVTVTAGKNQHTLDVGKAVRTLQRDGRSRR